MRHLHDNLCRLRRAKLHGGLQRTLSCCQQGIGHGVNSRREQGRIPFVRRIIGIVCIVAEAIGQLQLRIVQLHDDRVIVAVPLVAGGVVAEAVVVGPGLDGLVDGVLQAIRVDEGLAACLVGHLQHGAVLAGGLVEEGLGVFLALRGVRILHAGVLRIHGGIHHQAARIHGEHGDMAARQQGDCLAELIFAIAHGGKGSGRSPSGSRSMGNEAENQIRFFLPGMPAR